MSLSPGKDHESVPRDRDANADFRRELYRTPKYDRAGVIELCRRDILFYTNVFVWQFNPTKVPAERVGPFVTWPCQDDALLKLLACVEDGKDAVLDKSREMGASWMCLILFEWLWHFTSWNKFIVMSKDEKSVENAADSDSLFWKIDFIHDHLPPWLRPKGYDRDTHRRHGKAGSFYNPETHSSITGVASTGRAGVGGRATAMFVDEFSQIKEDREVLHRTSNTTPCRIFNGTHLGMDTGLFELTRRPDIRKVRLHWTQHPEKFRGAYRFDAEAQQLEVLDKTYSFPPDYKFILDGSPTGGAAPGVRSPYYDDECVRKGSTRAVAMDLDIDPTGSQNQFFDPILIRHLQAAYCRPPVWTGDATVSEDGKVVEFVAGDSGKLLFWRPLTIDGLVPSGQYAAGADTSEGKGATPSVLSILDANTGEKVCEYSSANVEPRTFARLCVALCRAFADTQGSGALFAWEAQGPGTDVTEEVVLLGYRRIYYRTNEFDLQKKQSLTPGWYPSPANKRLVMGNYRDALRQRQFENPSERALEETLAFEESNYGVECDTFASQDDPSGASVCHGDRVVADALAWMMKLKICAPVKPGRGRFERPAELTTNSLAGRRAYHDALATGDDG